MAWELEWGSSIQMLQEIQESTGETPKALLNRPVAREDCTKYRVAYNWCSQGRQFNQAGLQAITLGEIHAYLSIVQEYRLSEREAYMRMILAQDSVFMEYVREKTESQSKKQTA